MKLRMLLGVLLCFGALSLSPCSADEQPEPTVQAVLSQLDEIIERLDRLEARMIRLELAMVGHRLRPDENGISRDKSGQSIGIWGIDGPPGIPNRR